ncbi:MAG: YlzJ-like family protein [Clostridia bacterium]|nr:YlzJ-like family protein [Clostridia bacterium]
MIIHSIVCIENIFWDNFSEKIEEIDYQGVMLQAIKTDYNKYKIIRIISSNPNDYMRQDIQPGSEICF